MSVLSLSNFKSYNPQIKLAPQKNNQKTSFAHNNKMIDPNKEFNNQGVALLTNQDVYKYENNIKELKTDLLVLKAQVLEDTSKIISRIDTFEQRINNNQKAFTELCKNNDADAIYLDAINESKDQSSNVPAEMEGTKEFIDSIISGENPAFKNKEDLLILASHKTILTPVIHSILLSTPQNMLGKEYEGMEAVTKKNQKIAKLLRIIPNDIIPYNQEILDKFNPLFTDYKAKVDKNGFCIENSCINDKHYEDFLYAAFGQKEENDSVTNSDFYKRICSKSDTKLREKICSLNYNSMGNNKNSEKKMSFRIEFNTLLLNGLQQKPLELFNYRVALSKKILDFCKKEKIELDENLAQASGIKFID